MAWEDVDFLGDVGSRLKHVLNTKPVYRLSNLLSHSPSPSPSFSPTSRREEYFDVEGDREEFVMAKKQLPCSSSVGVRFLVDEVKNDEAAATTLLLLPSSANSSMILDEEIILFPSYHTTTSASPSTSSSTTITLSPSPEIISGTLISASKQQGNSRSSNIPDTINSLVQPSNFISMTNNTVDDTYLQHPPAVHVDYLSHTWTEEAVSASWRHSRSSRNDDGSKNRTRLENASWRVWARTRLNLGTLPAEKINWIKDDDVTWLYGPFVPRSKSPMPGEFDDTANVSLDPRRTMSLDLDAPRDVIFDTALNVQSKSQPTSILRIPTLEEVLRSRSVLELAPNRHLAPVTLESSKASISSSETKVQSPCEPDEAASISKDTRPSLINNTARNLNVRRAKDTSVTFNTNVDQAQTVMTHRDNDEGYLSLDEVTTPQNVGYCDKNGARTTKSAFPRGLNTASREEKLGESSAMAAARALPKHFKVARSRQESESSVKTGSSAIAVRGPRSFHQESSENSARLPPTQLSSRFTDAELTRACNSLFLPPTTSHPLKSLHHMRRIASSDNDLNGVNTFASDGIPHAAPRSVSMPDAPSNLTPHPISLPRTYGESIFGNQSLVSKRRRREQVPINDDSTKDNSTKDKSRTCDVGLGYCTVMKSLVPDTTPYIEILTDEDFFELEMFGLPPTQAGRTSYNEERDLEARSNTSSPSMSEYLSSSSSSLEDVELTSSMFDVTDFDESPDNSVSSPSEKHVVISAPVRLADEEDENEEKMPVGSGNYFSQYSNTYRSPSSTSMVKDRVFSATSCSTEARTCGTGRFGVQIPQVETPMAMDDEEYWWMNV